MPAHRRRAIERLRDDADSAINYARALAARRNADATAAVADIQRRRDADIQRIAASHYRRKAAAAEAQS